MEYTFVKWDQELTQTFKKATTITAKYKRPWEDIKPIPGVEVNKIITPINTSPTIDQYRKVTKVDGNPIPHNAEITVVTKPDVSKTGDTTAKIKITFPYGSGKIVDVPILVVPNVIPEDAFGTGGIGPEDVPENYVKITIDPTWKGTLPKGQETVFYVNPEVEVTLDVVNPTGKHFGRSQYIFREWEKPLKGTFTKSDIIRAFYNEVKDDPTIYDSYEYGRRYEAYNHFVPKDVNKADVLRHKLYIVGFPNGNFYPEENIKRSEVAAIFARLLSDRIDFGKTNTIYSDVDANHWASGAIAYLTDKHILSGRPDGSFDPNANMTRAEYATVLARMQELKSGKGNFTDVKGHWAQDAINALAEKGYTRGYEDQSFKPDLEITRAEAVTMTNKALDRYGDLSFIQEKMPQEGIFPDVLKSHWAYREIYEASTTHDYSRNKDNSETWVKIIEMGRVVAQSK